MINKHEWVMHVFVPASSEEILQSIVDGGLDPAALAGKQLPIEAQFCKRCALDWTPETADTECGVAAVPPAS